MMKRTPLSEAAGKTLDKATICHPYFVMKWTDGTYSCIHVQIGYEDYPEIEEGCLSPIDYESRGAGLISLEDHDKLISEREKADMELRIKSEVAELARLKAKYEGPTA